MSGPWLFATLVATAWVAAGAPASAAAPAAPVQFGTEYYLFSRARLLSRKAIDISSLQSLPGDAGLSVGADPALAPLVSLKVPTMVGDTVGIGDPFAVEATVSSRSYLTIVDFGSSGTIGEIFPAGDAPRPVEEMSPITLDGTEAQRWTVSGPPGTEYVLAFATSQPVTIPRGLTGPGPALNLVGRLQDFKNEIRHLCEEGGIDVGFEHVALRIVEGRGGNEPAGRTPATLATPGSRPDPSDVHALLVGINRYPAAAKGILEDLTAPVADARAMRQKMVEAMKVPPGQVRLLTDSQATRGGILEGLEWLGRAGRGKSMYFYYSGHGAYDPQTGPEAGHRALVPADFDYEEVRRGGRGNLLYDTDIGGWIDRTEGRDVVMVFDSCYSGAVTRVLAPGANLRPKGFFIPPARGSKIVVVREGRPVALNTRKKGTFIIMASQYDQQAFEDVESGHSLLTAAILRRFGDGLTGRQIFQETHDFVSEAARSGGQVQIPVLVDNTGDPTFVPFSENP